MLTGNQAALPISLVDGKIRSSTGTCCLQSEEGTKANIYSYILHHPGSYFREILRSTKIGTGNLQYVLYLLEQEGKITARKIGFYKHFYPSQLTKDKEKNILSILSQDSPREILIFLASHPGSCQSDVARHIKCTSSTARWYLARLETLGLVWSIRQKGEKNYYTNISVSELSELLKTYRPSIWDKYADRMADTMRTFDQKDTDER
jgi:predicted transcriptional regulator